MPPRRRLILGSILMVSILAPVCYAVMPHVKQLLRRTTRSQFSVDDRLAQFGWSVQQRLQPVFESEGVGYPPESLAFVVFKDAKMLELYGKTPDQPWKRIKTYPVLAASGTSGPKLRAGDQQVPEGIYEIDALNPNSRFHVSLRLNYPNEFDRSMAERDSRTKLGGDIMIHGNSVSIGCLAMGDEAAEELFALAAMARQDRVRVIICPTDFRTDLKSVVAQQPAWIDQLYDDLRDQLRPFPK